MKIQKEGRTSVEEHPRGGGVPLRQAEVLPFVQKQRRPDGWAGDTFGALIARSRIPHHTEESAFHLEGSGNP